MDTLVRENRNGTQQSQAEQFIAPMASLSEHNDGYELQIEMPGVNKEGLQISIENNELTIIGRRSLPRVEGTPVHREMRQHNFRRSFELDPSIDTEKIDAKLDQGVLKLNLPKAEQVKPRKITVS
jgi:HSP20 family protein